MTKPENVENSFTKIPLAYPIILVFTHLWTKCIAMKTEANEWICIQINKKNAANLLSQPKFNKSHHCSTPFHLYSIIINRLRSSNQIEIKIQNHNQLNVKFNNCIIPVFECVCAYSFEMKYFQFPFF